MSTKFLTLTFNFEKIFLDICWYKKVDTNILVYSNIFCYKYIRIFVRIIFLYEYIRIFVRIIFLIQMYSDIHLYRYLDIDIFKYSFVSKIYVRHTLIRKVSILLKTLLCCLFFKAVGENCLGCRLGLIAAIMKSRPASEAEIWSLSF